MNVKNEEARLLEEMKSLAGKISNVQSFSGLLMYQSDIQRFYEDFIFLKKLNERRDLKESLNSTSTENEVETHIQNEEKEPVLTEISTTEIAEENNNEKPKLDYNFSIQSKKAYPGIQLDLNDQIGFVNTLFKGDRNEFQHFIENLNNRNATTSVSYISHYEEKMNWGKKQEEFVNRLKELNDKRFE